MNKEIKVPVEISARHLHLSTEDFQILFDNKQKLECYKKLSQSGEFASKQVVDLCFGKKIIKNVRIVGPLRSQTQIELSISDCYYLGVKPILKISGDLESTPGIVIKNNKKVLKIKNGVIVAKRHWHLNSTLAEKYKLKTGDVVVAKVKGQRSGLLGNIIVRCAENYHSHLHLDTDEANAFNLKANDQVFIVL